MEPFIQHSGIAAPLPGQDINTDLIYPQRFLRKPDRASMGEFLFHGLRHDASGEPRPDFILNREPYSSATILIAGRNFGSGSSREHAPWALKSAGFRCLISSQFADIFKANCVNNGVLPAVVSDDLLAACLHAAMNPQDTRFEVDLTAREITHPRLGTIGFEISDSDRDRLMNGSDFIDDSLKEAAEIGRFEQVHATRMPWLGPQHEQ